MKEMWLLSDRPPCFLFLQCAALVGEDQPLCPDLPELDLSELDVSDLDADSFLGGLKWYSDQSEIISAQYGNEASNLFEVSTASCVYFCICCPHQYLYSTAGQVAVSKHLGAMEHICIHSDFIICPPRGREWAGIITRTSKHHTLSHSWTGAKQYVQLLPVYKYAFYIAPKYKKER